MKEIQDILVELLDPTKHQLANQEWTKLKTSDMDNTLLRLCEIVNDPKIQHSVQLMASIEIKNSLNKYWTDQEGENLQIIPTTITKIAHRIYGMIQNSKNNKLTFQLVDIFKNMVFNEPQSFDADDFLATIDKDIRDIEINAEIKTFSNFELIEKSFICLKEFLKMAQLAGSMEYKTNWQKIIDLMEYTWSKLDIKTNTQIIEIIFKIYRYFMEKELSLNKEISQDIIGHLLRICKIVFNADVYQYFLNYHDSHIKNQRCSYFGCLSTIFKTIISICSLDCDFSENKQEALNISLEFVPIICQSFSSSFAKDFVFDISSNKFFHHFNAYISCLYHHSEFQTIDDGFIKKFIMENYIPILKMFLYEIDEINNNIDSYLIDLIVPDSTIKSLLDHPKYDTIKHCVNFSFRCESLTTQLFAEFHPKCLISDNYPDLEQSAYILLLSWLSNNENNTEDLQKIISSITDHSNLIQMPYPNLNDFIHILIILNLLNSVVVYSFIDVSSQKSICEFLFQWIKKLLNNPKSSSSNKTSSLCIDHQSNEALFECLLTCLTNLIDDSSLDDSILLWINDHTVNLLNICLNIDFDDKNNDDHIESSSHPSLKIMHLDTQFERFSTVKSRLLQVMSNFELQEVCQYSLEISQCLVESISNSLHDLPLPSTAANDSKSNQAKLNDECVSINRPLTEISSMLRALENLVLISKRQSSKSLKKDSHSDLDHKFIEVCEFVLDRKIDSLFTDTFDIITALTSHSVSDQLIHYIGEKLVQRLDKDDNYYEFKDVAPIIHNCLENISDFNDIKEFISGFVSILSAILCESDEIFMVEHEFTLASKILEVILLNFGKSLDEVLVKKIWKIIKNFMMNLGDDFDEFLNKINSQIGFLDSQKFCSKKTGNPIWFMYNHTMINCFVALSYASGHKFIEFIKQLPNVNCLNNFMILLIHLSNSCTNSHLTPDSDLHSMRLYNMIIILNLTSISNKQIVKDCLLAIGSNNVNIKKIMDDSHDKDNEKALDYQNHLNSIDAQESDYPESNGDYVDSSFEPSNYSEEFIVTHSTMANYKSRIDETNSSLDLRKVLIDKLDKLTIDGQLFNIECELERSQIDDLKLKF